MENTLFTQEVFKIISKELIDPLTTIQGYSELLLLKPNMNHDKRIKFTHYINEKANELRELIHNLLDYQLIQMNQGLNLKLEPRYPKEFIDKALLDYKFELLEKKINIDIDTNIILNLDTYRFEQLIKIILLQLIQRSTKEDELKIKCRTENEKFTISFIDTGAVFTKEQIDIFTTVNKNENPTKEIDGLLLIITLAKSIIEAHKGEIIFNSTKEKGTQIQLIFNL